jgi:hypothetical protein
MDPVKDMRHDHAELRTLASNISQSRNDAAGERDQQFKEFRNQVRCHLNVVEGVLLGESLGVGYGRSKASGIKSEHKSIRSELKRLDRKHKQSDEWSAEFRNFTEHFDQLCKRHEALMTEATSRVSSDRLERDYRDAKYQEFNKSGMASAAIKTVASLAGAAAVVGTAYAANRFFNLGDRVKTLASGEDEFRLRLQTDEDLFLISSRKVEGTPVVDREGARIGHIDSFMVDKYTGRVAYAVMSFGGTLGFGNSLFPLPWDALDYEEDKGGYVLQISKERMEQAPRFEASGEPEFNPEYRRTLLVFYEAGESGSATNRMERDSTASSGRSGAGHGSEGSAFNQFGTSQGGLGDNQQTTRQQQQREGGEQKSDSDNDVKVEGSGYSPRIDKSGL